LKKIKTAIKKINKFILTKSERIKFTWFNQNNKDQKAGTKMIHTIKDMNQSKKIIIKTKFKEAATHILLSILKRNKFKEKYQNLQIDIDVMGII
jgi:hypothetical protein